MVCLCNIVSSLYVYLGVLLVITSSGFDLVFSIIAKIFAAMSISKMILFCVVIH